MDCEMYMHKLKGYVCYRVSPNPDHTVECLKTTQQNLKFSFWIKIFEKSQLHSSMFGDRVDHGTKVNGWVWAPNPGGRSPHHKACNRSSGEG